GPRSSRGPSRGTSGTTPRRCRGAPAGSPASPARTRPRPMASTAPAGWRHGAGTDSARLPGRGARAPAPRSCGTRVLLSMLPGCGRGPGAGEASARVREPGLLDGDRPAVAEHSRVHDDTDEERMVAGRDLRLDPALHVTETRGDQRRAGHAVPVLELLQLVRRPGRRPRQPPGLPPL